LSIPPLKRKEVVVMKTICVYRNRIYELETIKTILIQNVKNCWCFSLTDEMLAQSYWKTKTLPNGDIKHTFYYPHWYYCQKFGTRSFIETTEEKFFQKSIDK
jgi:hypothetical protein